MVAQDRGLSAEVERAKAEQQEAMRKRRKALIKDGMTDHRLLLRKLRKEFGGWVSSGSVAGYLHRHRQNNDIPAPPSIRWTQKEQLSAKPDFSLVGQHAPLDNGCSWVVEGRRFCGCATEPGKPYCFDHCMIAYPRFAALHLKEEGGTRKKQAKSPPTKFRRAGRLVAASGVHI